LAVTSRVPADAQAGSAKSQILKIRNCKRSMIARKKTKVEHFTEKHVSKENEWRR
jgi:hypothetical protein